MSEVKDPLEVLRRLHEKATPGELLPCPFCGGEGRILYFGCPIVACSSPDCMNRGFAADSDDEAIAAWNRRAVPLPLLLAYAQSQSDLIDRLKAEIDSMTPGSWGHDGKDREFVDDDIAPFVDVVDQARAALAKAVGDV